jgi:hypothetical protein
MVVTLRGEVNTVSNKWTEGTTASAVTTNYPCPGRYPKWPNGP